MPGYTVNGVNLENPTYGWYALRRTQALTGVSKGLSNLQVPGRHGVIPGIKTYKSAPTASIVVRTPLTGLEALYAVFEQNGGYGTLRLTDDATRTTRFELASIDSDGITDNDSIVNVTATLRFPTADWRAVTPVELSVPTLATAITTHSLFSGISSDVSDALVFVGGNFGNFVLKDPNNGSWVKTVRTWPNVAGTGLLYNSATGQAFRSNTATPYTPATDMSVYVDASGGGGLRFSPKWTTDPSVRTAQAELTVTNTSGVNLRVQGNTAYALRNGSI